MNMRFKLVDVVRASKNLVRTGWMQRGVPPSMGETVAEHSYEAAILALEIALRAREKGVKLDVGKVASMALVHDLAESIVGDLPKWTGDKIGKIKVKLEREALSLVGIHNELLTYFEEYVEGKSVESKIVKAADALSTCIQAKDYLLKGYDVHQILESSKKQLDKMAKCCKGAVEEMSALAGCI